jgi:excinuclease ABC subunit C
MKEWISEIEKAEDACGVYLIKRGSEILYVGKARSLRKRLAAYREPISTKQALLISQADSIEWFVADSEMEALILEANLIKQHKPRFNVSLKDDKSYPFIKITKEPYPRICFTRKIKDDGRYFGPYADAGTLRKTIRLCRELFKIRACRKSLRKRESPCLSFHIEQCLAPCTGGVSPTEYKKAVDGVISFLSSDHKRLLRNLERAMREEASKLRFEEAAKIRDKMKMIELLDSHQKVFFLQPIQCDLIASSAFENRVCVIVISVRRGRMVGEYPFFFEKKDEIIQGFIKQYYLSVPHIPKEIGVEDEIEDRSLLSEWLSGKRGDKVKIVVPKKGKRRELIELAKRNAHLLLIQRGEMPSLSLLKKSLKLRREPNLIEGIDISNIGGREAYGSVVVFEHGLPKKELYRSFKIKRVPGQDDYECIREVVERRYTRLLRDSSRLPDLIVIDGGRAHLNAAHNVLMRLGLSTIPIVSIAKSPDRIFLVHKREPVPISSSPLSLIQYVRDEAHRFSLKFHRRKRERL